MAKERTVEDIRAEIAGTRSNLKTSFADLRESIEPRNLLQAGVDDVKQFAQAQCDEAKKQFIDEDGQVRTKRVLAIAGAFTGVVVFAITVNALAGRRQVGGSKGRKALTAK